MQSGTANMPWATTSQAEARRRSLELAFDYLHCPRTTNMSEVAACLRTQPATLIVHEQWVSRGVVQFPFLPVVDGAFLSRRWEMGDEIFHEKIGKFHNARFRKLSLKFSAVA